jgi:hypothetical protein
MDILRNSTAPFQTFQVNTLKSSPERVTFRTTISHFMA